MIDISAFFEALKNPILFAKLKIGSKYPPSIPNPNMAHTPDPKIESLIVGNERLSSTDEYNSYVQNSASGLFQFGDSKVDVRAHDCGTRVAITIIKIAFVNFEIADPG